MKLMAGWVDGMRKHEDHQVVVLSQVLASSLTVGFTNFYNTVLNKFNGMELRNLEHLIKLVDSCKTEYVNFELDGENCIVLAQKDVQKHASQILQENMIPHDRSSHFRK